ncbi:cathepsin G-like [Cervus canadensis]|uniref:cathepsin G-like n=1 Tax=Cervus canadensis TaxID=1574408 RepID=UPI001C9E73B8|nr:cathepsin G-like [Cervus canadensis]
MRPLLLLVAFLLFPRARAGQIIGGREARPHSCPYMAFILIRTPGGLKVCGGFLVRDDFVMTAAHCLGSQMNVILGAHNVRTLEGTQQRVPVLRPIPHPGYSPQSHSNDIMLLQLVNRVQRNQFMRPVPLPQTQNRLRPGTRCTVAGWGLTGPNTRTDTLHCVQLRVQRDRVCRRRFMSYNGRTQICVGDPRQKSAFVGDSGGPLVCNNVAQGIVFYGDRMGTPPAFFTTISSFLPWIRRTMRCFKEWRPE